MLTSTLKLENTIIHLCASASAFQVWSLMIWTVTPDLAAVA